MIEGSVAAAAGLHVGDTIITINGQPCGGHRDAIAATHFEDLRGVLASWRYLHRWVALLAVLLVIAHIITAMRYADLGGLG